MLDGKIQPLSDCRVPVLDRGFLFGDGVYEVARLYGGRAYLWDEHLARLSRSAREIQLPDYNEALTHSRVRALLAHLPSGLEGALYIQLTRGAPVARTHAFGKSEYTEFMYVSPLSRPAPSLYEHGCSVISCPDQRWGRCDIKSINLLGNVLAAQKAKEAQALEAILVNGDGNVTEGSHTSLFWVKSGTLHTMPLTANILPGITRAKVLELSRAAGIPVEETSANLEWFERSEEAFLTSTTWEVMPISRVNGKSVGSGGVGPVTRRLMGLYSKEVEAFIAV